MSEFTVQGTEEQPGNQLQFVLIDGRLILHQMWWIFEWGNKECFGRPMNKRSEWRAVPIGVIERSPHGSQTP